MLPGAAPAEPQGANVAPAKHRRSGASTTEAGAGAKGVKAGPAAGIASLAGRPLMLNGKSGLLQISGDDRTATIDKLQLAGESVSNPSQRCVVDIVGEKPILATSAGRPDGLERFEADVPACPISFDVLDGAALVPSQITACVFKAADCQTIPGGLWGPDGASLVGDAAKIVKERAEAEKAMAKLVRAIEDRAGQRAGGRPGARSERLCRPARRTLPRLRQGERPRLLRLARHRSADRAFADAARCAHARIRPQSGERKRQEGEAEEGRQAALAELPGAPDGQKDFISPVGSASLPETLRVRLTR